MRRRSLLAACLGAFALAGCHGLGGTTPPADGVLTVRITPAPLAVDPLVAQSAKLQIEKLTVLGDVAPDGRAMVSEFNLDLRSSGAAFTLTMLPQGLYSRVRFNIDHFALQGTWRGMPLQISVEHEEAGAAIDLRSAGVEVTPGHDAELVVGVDSSTWFADNLLDSATVEGGQIAVDGSHNTALAATLTARLATGYTLQDATPIR